MQRTEPPTALMLFAAGFGTRMKPLTDHRPKPMIPVAGKPLIDHALEIARDANCALIVANLHYLPGPLIAHLHPQGVQTIIEEPDILETGGGVRNALPVLGHDPILTLNSDAIWLGPNPLTLLQKAWRPDEMDALLLCLPPEQTQGFQGGGDFVIDSNGRLSRGPGVIYGGAQILKTSLLSEVAETAFSLNVIWDKMLARGRLFGLIYPGLWCDVGHPDGITLAEEMIKTHHV